MKKVSSKKYFSPTRMAFAVATTLAASNAFADAVTDWNLYSTLATKGATSTTTGDKTLALNSNVATRIDAIAARAVFDAVNAVNQFSHKKGYYYVVGATGGSAPAAAAKAAHDVLIGTLPTLPTWDNTRAWLDAQLAADLAALGVNPATDHGVIAGQNAAAAALTARAGDNSAINTSYIPSTNISATGTATATGNPGIGFWRPSNGGAGVVDLNTGAPTGFDSIGAILPTAGITFNWKNITPFSLSTSDKQQLVALVPPSLKIGSPEYNAELAFVKSHGQEFSSPGNRTNDQLLQALYFKIDAELPVNELARIASKDRHLNLNQNAKLFAALDSALADARIAAFQSKYDLTFWRPITALNADAAGAATDYLWKPLGSTPSHPSSTAGHSTTFAAGVEILRAFFKSDDIVKAKKPQKLTVFPWIKNTNNGTGLLAAPIGGKDGATRDVATFTQAQLENGRSRIYLGVHFANDDFQGQTLGLSVADKIINDQKDPAVVGLSIYNSGHNIASAENLYKIFVKNSNVSGFYGLKK
ncbi:MAG: hypothetical protein RLZ75_845 [Pseudomonadota bacterium]|jgi:hypothetical protein